VASVTGGRQSKNSQNCDLINTAEETFHLESHQSIELQVHFREDSAREELRRVAELNKQSCPTDRDSSEPEGYNSVSEVPLPDSPLTDLSSEEERMTGENENDNLRKLEKSLPAALGNDVLSSEKEADEDDIIEFLEQFEDVVNKYQPSLWKGECFEELKKALISYIHGNLRKQFSVCVGGFHSHTLYFKAKGTMAAA
jgi:hypothetical protein